MWGGIFGGISGYINTPEGVNRITGSGDHAFETIFTDERFGIPTEYSTENATRIAEETFGKSNINAPIRANGTVPASSNAYYNQSRQAFEVYVDSKLTYASGLTHYVNGKVTGYSFAEYDFNDILKVKMVIGHELMHGKIYTAFGESVTSNQHHRTIFEWHYNQSVKYLGLDNSYTKAILNELNSLSGLKSLGSNFQFPIKGASPYDYQLFPMYNISKIRR
jgi:hypothetical protein